MMKKKNRRKMFRFTAVCTAISIGMMSFPAYAAEDSPTRTDEEWAKLQDNTLEYGEIADLVHEYNATCKKTQYEYIDFRRDYGETNDEVSDAYQDAANDLWDSLEYPDSDDDNYASAMVAAANTEASAKQMEQQALETLEDSHIKYLEMCQEEDQLVSEAQSSMISYYSKQLEIEDAENDQKKAEDDVKQTEVKVAAGTATQSELLSAQADAQTAANTVESEKASLQETKESLNVLCGWKAEDNPEIGTLPDLDLSVIDTFDPQADLETAYQNNYTVRINQRKLENATAQADKDTLNVTLKDNREKIASALTTDYKSVTTALDTYRLAESNAELEKTKLTQMQAKVNAGMATQSELTEQEYTTTKAENTLQRSAWSLFDAIRTYQWDVNGLANAS